LRERREDIPLLFDHFAQRAAERLGRNVEPLSGAQLGRLLSHDWPGNVRELANGVKRAVIMADGSFVRAQDLELSDAVDEIQSLNLRRLRNETERRSVLLALDRHANNISAAANELGIARPTLYKLLLKYDINIVEGEQSL